VRQITLATSGNFTQTAYASDLGYVATYQQGDRCVVTEIDITDTGLLALVRARHDMGGASGGFPRVVADPAGGLALAWRRGAPPYRLCTLIRGIYREYPFDIHGMYPVAFGSEWIVFQDTATYRLRRGRLGSDLMQAEVIGEGRPTGLSHVLPSGSPVLIDTLKAWPPTGVYKSYAADVSAREADGAHGPEVQVVKDDGRLVRLWQGQNSTFPWISTDGPTFLIGTEGDHAGVRCALVEQRDFVAQAIPEPFGVATSTPKALGYFFGRSSKYGSFDPKETSAVLPLDAWQDGDGTLPHDVGAKICTVLRTVGVGAVSNTAILHATPEWGRVTAVLAGHQETPQVWAHEPENREQAAVWVAETRNQMRQAGVPLRPTVTFLREDRAADPSFVGVADVLAPEIYFRTPQDSYDAQLEVARSRIAEVCTALAPSPLYLCIQAFDRIAGGTQWRDKPWAIEAIQQAANEAITRPQVLGLWWFAYARPGGVRAYPQLEPWHVAQVAVTPQPAKPVDPTTPKPPNPKPPIPGDDMTHEQLRGYMTALNDPLIFGALARFHNEVLPRDRPVDPVKTAEGGPFNTSDVVTGGAMGYFLRRYCAEAAIAMDKGRTPEQASGDGYDAAIKSYRDVVNPQ
jgi:hypothetical protein